MEAAIHLGGQRLEAEAAELPHTSWMGPMLPPDGQREIEDAAFDLIVCASSLAGQTHPIVSESIGELVRSMNCYYSNLIEGHNTHPRDIDRALQRDYSREPERRALQLEAAAHIEVQRAIERSIPGRTIPGRTTRRFPLRPNLDGRGNLSQAALVEFCEFFLATCVDQVKYMRSVLDSSELLRRMEIYVEDEVRAGRLPRGSFPLLREALLAGQFERGQAPALTGYKERMARTVLARLLELGMLLSPGPKSPVRLGFPLVVVDR